MANKRQKKKKSAAAAKQAAANYKGKNAPVRAAAPAKKPEPKPQPVPEKKPEVKKEVKQEVKQAVKKQPKPQQPKAAPEKKTADKKAAPKKKTKSDKPKNALGKKLAYRIRKFGVNKFAAIVLAISVVIAAVCVGLWVGSSRFSVPKEARGEYLGRTIPESSTYYVDTDLASQYEFAKEMNAKGDTKKFRYYAAKEVVLEEKYSKAMINLVNVFDNNCVLVASIVDQAGNILYHSLGLEAGKGIGEIGINSLRYGTHEMKLVVAAYDPETYEYIGVQYSDLTVQVGIEEETTHEQSTAEI